MHNVVSRRELCSSAASKENTFFCSTDGTDRNHITRHVVIFVISCASSLILGIPPSCHTSAFKRTFTAKIAPGDHYLDHHAGLRGGRCHNKRRRADGRESAARNKHKVTTFVCTNPNHPVYSNHLVFPTCFCLAVTTKKIRRVPPGW